MTVFRPAAPLLLSPLLLLPPLASGALRGPYAPDAATVHLFHLDEAAGTTTAVNAVSGGAPALAFDGATALNHATNPQPPAGASVLGAASGPSGFGAAASIATANLGLGLDANGSGGFQLGTATVCPDAIAHSTLTAADGSFTLEALVNLPALTGASREIVCTDSALASRGFQFRINTSGQLEFNFIATSAASTVFAIPTSGANAFAANQWFHAALVFDGATHTSSFYWTRFDATAESASLLGSSTAETTTGTVTGPLVIGNEGRITGNSTEGLLGLIDEVRISRIARGPGDFLFAGPDLTDSDGDGLPDSWETRYFPDLAQDGEGDPDGDTFSNAAEYAAGSDPARAASTPLDTDADGLADAWEIRYFGNLNPTPTGDPDGEGESNLTEQANGTAPNHRASNSTDTDADGIPDALELASFGTLDTNGGSDPDGDGFSNLQEVLAGTDPADPASRPPGTAVKLVPLDDGDPATSDFGYGGESAINSVSFVRSSLKTVGDQQFITWYGRHQYDAAAPFNNTLWIGRRTLGSSKWEIFRHPSFTANNIGDGHDVISYGIDGEGYMHLSWGMHGDAFHYTRSTSPVTGSAPIVLGPDTTMTGREDAVTYPQFLKLPDGDLLFVFREVASGNGDTYLNRWDTATHTWDNVRRSGNTQLPFIKGTGWTPNYNAYLNMPQLGGDGDDLTLTWCWRYEPVGNDSPGGFDGYQTNNHFSFARSPDAGVTWQRSDGTPYSLPISRDAESGVEATRAERIVSIPEGSSLINQASMCLDRAGNPVIASWWAPGTAAGDYRRQYMVVFRHADGSWQTRPVSHRNLDPTTTRYSETYVRDLGRPIVVDDDADRVIVVYRDNDDLKDDRLATDPDGAQSADNGLTVVHSLPLAADPDRLVWIQFDLTRDNLGNYEPIIDNELWDRDRQLHFLYQPATGLGYTAPANTASRISVLEWDTVRYFAHEPQPAVSVTADGGSITITTASEPSWGYRLWTSANLADWEQVSAFTGTGAPLTFSRPLAAGEAKRFWRLEYREGGF